MKHLAVPYALTPENTLADPATIPRETPCICLECGEKVELRRGTKRVAYFAHQKGSQCSGESVLHKAAKMRLAGFFFEHRGERLTLDWSLPCPGTRKRHVYRKQIETSEYPCPKDQLLFEKVEVPKFDRVVVEFSHGDFQADVALLDGSEVVFWVEVFHKHRVPTDKALGLQVPWIEVSAEGVFKDPAHLQVINWHGLQIRCGHCQQRQGQFDRLEARDLPEIERILLKRQQERARKQKALLENMKWWEKQRAAQAAQEQADRDTLLRTYRFARKYFEQHGVDPALQGRASFIAMRCQQCKQPVVFFDTQEAIESPEDLNQVLVRSSKDGRPVGRWINICPHCGRWHALQVVQQSVFQSERPGIQFLGRDFLWWLNHHRQ